jgi:threonine dehydrogenase-like Zn-dependent dehydrogenase
MPWSQYPTEPGGLGHEGWGVVDAIGDGTGDLQRGDHVALVSYHAYAEYDVAPVEAVVKLPSELASDAFPGEAFGCAMNILARSRIVRGETAAIVGIGFLGATLTRLAHIAGARVLAISRRRGSLELARRLGADEVITMDDHYKIIDQVKQLTDGRGCDCVIESVGKQWPLDLAGELVCERGRLVIAGYHQDGPRQVNMQMWNWKGLDVINAHERGLEAYTAGIRNAIDVVVRKQLDPSPLLTHRYPLEGLAAAFDATRDRPDGFVKALVIYEQ